MVVGEERVGEEPNITTAEKAWPSTNHPLLSGRECVSVLVLEWWFPLCTHEGTTVLINKPSTQTGIYKGDISHVLLFDSHGPGIRHPRIANFQPKNWSGALLHEANYSIFNYLRWEEVVKGRGSRLETN
jgi:hypothetical protein